MKLPRNLGGKELIAHLEKYGYQIIRQRGSHIRLASTYKGREHNLTIPLVKPLKAGTLNGIVNEIANYLEIDKPTLVKELFKK